MVGILSPEILETALFKAASLEESPSWLSLTIISKDTMLPGSPALRGEALAGGLWLTVTGAEEDSEVAEAAGVAAEAETGVETAGTVAAAEAEDVDCSATPPPSETETSGRLGVLTAVSSRWSPATAWGEDPFAC